MESTVDSEVVLMVSSGPCRQRQVLIELTSPLEENLIQKHFEKVDKYNQPVIDLREGNPHRVKWAVIPLSTEVGASGATNEQPWNINPNPKSNHNPNSV